MPKKSKSHEAQNFLAERAWQIQDVKVEQLGIDRDVQQELRPGKVEGMLKSPRGFDLSLVGTITVSDRKGHPVIIDGQTRWEAAKACGVPVLPAVIWYDLTKEEEAWLFLYLNEKSNPPTLAKFLVGITMGDPTAIAIGKIFDDHGWRIAAGPMDGTFVAVGMARRIHEGRTEFHVDNIDGPQVLRDAVGIITSSWGMNRAGMDSNLLGGVAVVLARYATDANRKKVIDRLVEVLTKLTPERLRAEGKATQKTLTLSPVNAFGWQIHHHYNKGLRGLRSKLPQFEF